MFLIVLNGYMLAIESVVGNKESVQELQQSKTIIMLPNNWTHRRIITLQLSWANLCFGRGGMKSFFPQKVTLLLTVLKNRLCLTWRGNATPGPIAAGPCAPHTLVSYCLDSTHSWDSLFFLSLTSWKKTTEEGVFFFNRHYLIRLSMCLMSADWLLSGTRTRHLDPM